MGLCKKRIMEYLEEQYCYDLDTIYDDEEETNDQFNFSFRIWNTLKYGGRIEPDALTRDFFNDLFSDLKQKERIWVMASVGALVCNYSFGDPDRALEGICALRNQNVNLYFSPAIFKGWRKDKNVSRINTIYIDIDDIEEVDFSVMDEESLKEYLMINFHLTAEYLPNWVICSGHGLHLYYLVDTLNLKNKGDAEKRLKYTDYLITYFHADIACRNKSRILRFPGSKNVKHMDDIRVTRIFHLNTSSDRLIERLDYFSYSQSEIDAYAEQCKAKRAEKRRQTMIANGTLGKRKEKRVTVSKRKETPCIVKAVSSKRSKTSKPWVPSHPELKINNYPLESTTRYRRILRDLHNWAARRQGVPTGFRAIFTHIMAVYLKRMSVSQEGAVYYAEQYLDEEFMEEAKSIINSVYKTSTEYMYTNKHIAELLDFSEIDIFNSYALYTEGQKRNARKKTMNKYDDKRYGEQRAERKAKIESRYNYIKEHMEMTASALAKELGCSVRTIRYIKADIRKKAGD